MSFTGGTSFEKSVDDENEIVKFFKLKGIWRSNGFAFLFKIEKWNLDEDPYELRLYILWWELNFAVKNRKPINYFNNK